MSTLTDEEIEKIASAVVKKMSEEMFQIVKTNLQSGDDIFIKTPMHLSKEAHDRLKKQIEFYFPDHRVIVFEKVEIEIVHHDL